MSVATTCVWVTLFVLLDLVVDTFLTGADASMEVVSVAVGSSAVLRCQLDFPGGVAIPHTIHWVKQDTADVIFRWQDGQPPTVGEAYRNRLTLLSGASLNITQIRKSDLGLYECRIFLKRHNSDVIGNRSWVFVEIQDGGLHFTEEPLPQLLLPGQSLQLCCKTFPQTHIRWKVNGSFIQQSNNNCLVKSEGRLDGLYQCVAVLGDLQLGSRPVNVSVAVLNKFKGQSDVSVQSIVGGIAIIECNPPRSVPTGILRLERNGLAVGPSDRIHLLPRGIFKIQSVQQSDIGSYRCAIENPTLRITERSHHSINLIVSPNATRIEHSSPQLVVSPEPFYAVTVGTNLTLECVASGNPTPNLTWTKYGGYLPPLRHAQESGTLFLYEIRRGDEGTYVCQADNGIGLPVPAHALVEIQEKPVIREPLLNQTVYEGGDAMFECNVGGVPRPAIGWFHNAELLEANESVVIRGNQLAVKHVNLLSAGFYQCLATNDLGSEYSSARLRILPQIFQLPEETTAGNNNKSESDGKTKSDPNNSDNLVINSHNRHRFHDRKRNKKVNTGPNGEVLLVPPTRPQVTKLSDESVMVRWDIPPNDGLAVVFFKVQYKDVSKSTSRWMTIDDEIAPHIHSFEVPSLKTGHTYRFRIAAVYSNNDNNQGPVSSKFLLQKESSMKKPTVGPTILQLEAVSPSAILLQWQYVDVDLVPIEGFFVYYRATTTAAYYSKVTVTGASNRNHILSYLDPDTVYEVKMQCFNMAGTSEFSNIVMQKTQKSEIPSGGTQETGIETLFPVMTSVQTGNETLYLAIGIVLGSIIVILLIAMVICNWKQRQQRRQLLATLDQSVRGNYEDRKAVADMELSVLSSLRGHLSSNGHSHCWKGNGSSPSTAYHLANGSVGHFPEEYLNNNRREISNSAEQIDKVEESLYKLEDGREGSENLSDYLAERAIVSKGPSDSTVLPSDSGDELDS